MKSILLIGLGRFGHHVALKLNELGHQVMAVDRSEERIDSIMPYVSSGQIGDSTNQEFLAALGINNYDVCIVAIGGDFQSSLETTALLKELGAQKIVARASRDVHAKFLKMAGADEIVYPTGQASDTVPITFLTTLNWKTATPYSKWKSRKNGLGRPFPPWISASITTSMSLRYDAMAI